MRLGERREAIADPLFGLVGNLDPAMAHVDALTLKAKQHRCRILNINIEIRQRLIERRSEVAEPSIVEVKNRVEFAPLQVEQRAMPPKVMDQIVAAGKVSLVFFKQINPFALTGLHLHYVSHRVYTPEVGRVDLQGGPSRRLSRSIVTALFVGEAATRQDRAKARHVSTPFRKDLLDGSTHGLGSAKPKIIEMGQAEGDHVQRMFGDNVVPDCQGVFDVACDPGIQRST